MSHSRACSGPDAGDHVGGHVGVGGEREPHVAEHELERAVAALGADAREAHRGAADEAGDERVRRPLVDLVGIAALLDHAVAHDRDAVAHRHRLDLVVRDVDGRDADALLQRADVGAGLRAQLRVEVRERLVHEEHLRVADERAAERDALALPARELARLALEQRPELAAARRPRSRGGRSRPSAACAS